MAGLMSLGNVALDGTKISSRFFSKELVNASKHKATSRERVLQPVEL
jgi:hypothetical protein